MKHMVRVRWMMSLVALLLLSGEIAVAAPAGDRRRIVVFREGILVDVQQQVLALSGIKVLHVLSLVNALAIELPAVGTEAVLAILQALPVVQRVEDDPLIELQGAGSDGGFVTPSADPAREFYPWGIDWIGAADAQEQNPWLTGNGIKVALIDTGIDPTHPDLRRNVIGGYNAMAGQVSRNWWDDNGHGTHVAGTLAARMDRHGVIGVTPNLQIYALKALDRDGKGRTSDVINALQRVPRDVRIIAGSFGTDLVWPSFEKAIYRMYRSGKLMVFSVGNRCAPNGAQGTGSDGAGSDGAGSDASCSATPSDVKFPARYPWVIAVGASDVDDQVPTFSRSGPAMVHHGVVAPGVHIFSTNLGGGYGWMSGTSGSTPHVAGAIALACQLRPRLSYEEVLALLQETAEALGYPPEHQGAGRINVEKLVNMLMRKKYQ
jgi:subtilisin